MTDIGEMLGIDDRSFIYFGEISNQGNPMGSYKGMSVFAADGYRESIREGRTYYCSLEKKNNARFFHAKPLFELTLDRIIEDDPDSITKIAEIIYDQDRPRFDSIISAKQMREIQEEAEQKYKDKISRLERDNERLEKELKSKEKMPAAMTAVANNIDDHIEGDRFYSSRLEDKYYSARLNKRGDRLLLIKSDDGEYGGHGKCVDITPFKKILKTENIRGEYCQKYGGVVFFRA